MTNHLPQRLRRLAELHPDYSYVELEAEELYQAWSVLLTRLNTAPDHLDLEALITDEQRAFDNLVDYVEAEDLNGSQFDPRDPANH